MVFVADDLGAWLVGLLADAGPKKLTTLVLGTDQERALRQAATAAVESTAEQLAPSGGEQAEQLARVVSEIFRDPAPDAAVAGQATLLEALQAGIAGKLACWMTALTGAGQSSAELLGVQGGVLAETLAGHLVREIMVRGSGGGPLAPLADQLNHDVTHLQGRAAGRDARPAGRQVTALARPGGPQAPSKPVRLRRGRCSWPGGRNCWLTWIPGWPAMKAPGRGWWRCTGWAARARPAWRWSTRTATWPRSGWPGSSPPRTRRCWRPGSVSWPPSSAPPVAGTRWPRCTGCWPPARRSGCWCSTTRRTGPRWQRSCRRPGPAGC